MKIALATCARLPEPDPDEAPLLAALRDAEHDAQTLAWDDPEADETGFDVVLLRATWNYYERPADFLAWVDRVSQTARVLNPPPVVRWNFHKQYLAELGARGLPIVPSVFVRKRQRFDIARHASVVGWESVVVKPSVGAASFKTRLFGPGEFADAQAFLDELAGERDVMVQRYMPRVETDGERAIMWINGAVTHVVRKSVRLHGDDEEVSEGLTPTDADVAIAEQTLEILGAPHADDLLYARIDVMPADDGSLVLSELELIEPSLFFPQSEQALARFVDGVNNLAAETSTA